MYKKIDLLSEKGEKELQNINNKVIASQFKNLSMNEWRNCLNKECQVYVCNESFLAKRFDQINYQFCDKDKAKEIVINNLYALLRYKYFKHLDNEIDDLIDDIVKSFCSNLTTTLLKVSIDPNKDGNFLKTLSKNQCAFKNGVYDFKENKWLFKYEIIELEELNNRIYYYDKDYAILWYIDIDFEPISYLDINSINYEEMIDILREIDNNKKNYCFRLLYNMSFDIDNKFNLNKFKHLCEIMGYTLLRDFSQAFVMLIGSGQNGKNSLFDGCISHCLAPLPSNSDMDSIENDRFITGTLEGRYQNIFLESSAKTYSESKMIKALTGSMYQSIENKGINKYAGLINCKFIFAANDQDKIKFSDTTEGFRRRINMCELYYKWDSDKNYLKKGDYYEVAFSENLEEFKNDLSNTVIFIYLAFMGIKEATNNFTSTFKFQYNDYKKKYTDIDVDLKDRLDNVTSLDIAKFLALRYDNDEGKYLLYDENKVRLYQGIGFKEMGYKGECKEVVELLKDEESVNIYFSNYDAYINLRSLQKIISDLSPSLTFSTSIKKIYNINDFKYLHNNQAYVKIRFNKGRLKILK